MVNAIRIVLCGLLWSFVGFAAFSLSGLVCKSLGAIDFLVAGEPGAPLRPTPLALVLCGAFMGGGFAWGAISTCLRRSSSTDAR
jgi:hypothetical protein